jgi:hypothetical protein
MGTASRRTSMKKLTLWMLSLVILSGNVLQSSGYLASLQMNLKTGVELIVLSSAGGNGALNPNNLALKSLDLLSK